MHFPTALAAIAAVAPVVNGHGGPSLPKIEGLNIRDLKARSLVENLRARTARAAHLESHGGHQGLIKRQGGGERCGGDFGKCAEGYCCSGEGWCGKTAQHCYSPGCQWQYGPACYENRTPSGGSTSGVSRDKVGSVPYGGAGITSCTTAGTVALTFDDGPVEGYTDQILNILKKYDARATFFITGANIGKGAIDTTPAHAATIRRMYADGHQLASHTWTHLDLSKISETERKDQMYKLEMALRNIVGVFPTYMRPPYSSCSAASGCERTMADLGYHVAYFDVDTDDYNQNTPEKVQNAMNWFKGNITQGGATASNSDWLAIAHDIQETTATKLTEYMVSTLTELGYRAVPLGECLGDPSANWYRASSGSSSTTKAAPSATATNKVSTDATCGGTKGFTCKGSAFGNCCSVNGWCGSTDAYCGKGCQSAFGTCSSTPTSTKAPTAPTSTLKVSTDGKCAGTTGFTCKGSAFGNCCSQYGWCGSTTGHCGAGCNKSFGTCA